MRRSLLILLLNTSAALAWGPHTEIAQAALDVLKSDDPLAKHLGANLKRLSHYVWMADWRQQLLVRKDEVFYSDDVLIFPAAPKHYQHICPEVQQTYAPYFRRALQALRTESPHNAARWIGSLLHFTTDTGSPPHALGILGPVHSKMENWVDAKRIHIPGYQAQLLGADDAKAEAGYLRRMEGLIAYCKERALRCRADVEAGHRERVEPVVLEAALETARVTADLLHTLGVLAAQNLGTATLMGKIIPPQINSPDLARLPVKIMLAGTTFSTLTNTDGSFAFHHLPAGEYHPMISSLGCVMELMAVNLAPAAPVMLDPVDLTQRTDGNLIRNPNFKLHWALDEGFDHWSQRRSPTRLAGANPARDWEGEWIPLQSGVTYQLAVRWQPTQGGAEGTEVFVRTKGKAAAAAVVAPPVDSPAVTPGGQAAVSIMGSTDAVWAQVVVRSRQQPNIVLDEVRFTAKP